MCCYSTSLLCLSRLFDMVETAFDNGQGSLQHIVCCTTVFLLLAALFCMMWQQSPMLLSGKDSHYLFLWAAKIIFLCTNEERVCLFCKVCLFLFFRCFTCRLQLKEGRGLTQNKKKNWTIPVTRIYKTRK